MTDLMANIGAKFSAYFRRNREAAFAKRRRGLLKYSQNSQEYCIRIDD